MDNINPKRVGEALGLLIVVWITILALFVGSALVLRWVL